MTESTDGIELLPGANFLTPEQSADLLARWSQPHRRYHTVDHLKAVLAQLDSLSASGVPFDPEPVYLAAWFHDAVYEIDRSDNEAESARLARDMLSDYSPAVVDEVARLVEATTAHNVDAQDHNAAALMDADLAVLGGSPDEYESYAALVRAEYADVPDAVFGPARAAILDAMLSGGPIYATEYGRAHWEAAARDNVTTEITRLLTA
ncbi:hypothetical protein GOEFS_008_00130 [Gordonia effusa NBRC 100432]|uniref:HD domain-containing protein n=1 Tax=Gordonia effusa NBRC 100432 TaxID=1077974 RepID=H0QUV3_9ACTN|nr:hypothetical protein [Gordonia effusa]GAB16604.1 hypothetical protein GOEFS_008_00130 [Gordonia effusa NBRC 100432]